MMFLHLKSLFTETNFSDHLNFSQINEKQLSQIAANKHTNIRHTNIRHTNIKCTDSSSSNANTSDDNIEAYQVNNLIVLFNALFTNQQVILARSHNHNEPEYFPASQGQPARIEFAHGFFASALHELSHWCIAGKYRRTLPDFGYWYAPDGRSKAQQSAFESVEIKPQALECLFNLACQRHFEVSQDNLFADFDTSQSTFEQDVYKQVINYLDRPDTLPRDAKTLLHALVYMTAKDYWNVDRHYGLFGHIHAELYRI